MHGGESEGEGGGLAVHSCEVEGEREAACLSANFFRQSLRWGDCLVESAEIAYFCSAAAEMGQKLFCLHRMKTT